MYGKSGCMVNQRSWLLVMVRIMVNVIVRVMIRIRVIFRVIIYRYMVMVKV